MNGSSSPGFAGWLQDPEERYRSLFQWDLLQKLSRNNELQSHNFSSDLQQQHPQEDNRYCLVPYPTGHQLFWQHIFLMAFIVLK